MLIGAELSFLGGQTISLMNAHHRVNPEMRYGHCGWKLGISPGYEAGGEDVVLSLDSCWSVSLGPSLRCPLSSNPPPHTPLPVAFGRPLSA